MSKLTEKAMKMAELLLEHTGTSDTGLREERGLAEEILELAEVDPDRDELTTLARLAGERAGWPKDFGEIRVEIHKISQDVSIPLGTRTQAQMKGMAGNWGLMNALYRQIQRDHDILMLSDYLTGEVGEDLGKGVKRGECPLEWLTLHVVSELIEEIGKMDKRIKELEAKQSE